jgi:hypothetical protein
MGVATPPGLSNEKAARMMVALRHGHTLRSFGVRAPRLEAYFASHPAYALEARPLIAANNVAARLRKGERLRQMTHCKYGHPLFGANISYEPNGRRKCLTCVRRHELSPRPPTQEQIERVTAALNAGKTLSLICQGKVGNERGAPRILTFRKLNFYRRLNPAFDRFVISTTANNNSKAQRRRFHPDRARVETIRAETNDFYKIVNMVPVHLPREVRDDIAQSILMALLEGTLQRDQVNGRIRQFVAEHNRMFPTKYAKFGNSPLLSLDEGIV